jgi:4'-phosphopantetheinyl transferase
MIGHPVRAHDVEDEWKPAPGALAVGTDAVHVWRVPLALPDALLGWAESMLDDDERSRAERFHFRGDRVRFAAGRAIQRQLLAAYLGVGPEAVRYRTNAFGKPELATNGIARTAMDIRFNFSNSAELGLLAVTLGRSVGVDIEKLRAVPDAMQLAADWLSAADCAALDAAHPEQRERMFLSCWTRYEACAKAVGRGLSFRRGECAFAMRALTPAAGYVGALAVEGHDCTLRQFEWRVEDTGVAAESPASRFTPSS